MPNRPSFFKTVTGQKLPLPLFFPDATRAVVKSLDCSDIESTKTPGILVNTLHLQHHPGPNVIKKIGGIRSYMSWNGAAISDSGGFQIMSLAKKLGNKAITDKGINFKTGNTKKETFTPQISIKIQSALKTDLMVVLDDFTEPNASYEKAKETVDRTVKWAKICKSEFNKIYKNSPVRPYLIGVAQGGQFMDLRKECTQRLVDIGFDGLGWGGWPVENGKLDYRSAEVITKYSPKNYLLYGLGVGRPNEIAYLVKNLGWQIFDCVLPSRDARHRRLYVYNASSIKDINLNEPDFYSYYTPDKEKYYRDQRPVSTACDCLLCRRYSRSYLHHLFKIGDMTAGRLATIHNLRFYSILMEKLR